MMLAGSADGASPGGKTFGFAIFYWHTAGYDTKDGKEECPQGFAEDAITVWINSLSSGERAKVLKAGPTDSVNPELTRTAQERGPGGLDVCANPTSVKEPAMRIVGGKFSQGLNLDGTRDGHATPKTCAHQKFTSPNGTPGIDNQWYRLMGCAAGFRGNGVMEEVINSGLRDGGHAILMEIKGADDLRDSRDVEVVFSLSIDPLVKGPTGTEILPKGSYRAADNYRYSTRGAIADGVLTTEPIDIHFPFFQIPIEEDRYIRDMRLRIVLSPDGEHAKGLLAGYYDLDSLWNYLGRNGGEAPIGHYSCPAAYEAAHRLADGYPDPRTGACTALSAAFEIEAVSAFVIHPEKISRADGAPE
jgi:hypothetical protein